MRLSLSGRARKNQRGPDTRTHSPTACDRAPKEPPRAPPEKSPRETQEAPQELRMSSKKPYTNE
eukprot:7304831-Pyramimonas_sp.AAC.1